MRLKEDEARLIAGQMSRKDAVHKVIRAAILDGRLAAGMRLNQDEIAADLDVSRMPVREALKQLEKEGLITFYPYRGVEVARLGPGDIEEMFAIRIALEQLAVERAAQMLTSTDVTRMKQILKRMDQLTEDGGTQSTGLWMELNEDYHRIINNAAGWPRLIENIEDLRANVGRYVQMYLELRGRDQPQQEHWALCEALERGDVDLAKDLIAQHLKNTATELTKALSHSDSLQQEARRVSGEDG